MKNKKIIHQLEAARIYRSNYKSSINLIRLVKSVLAVLITGNGLTASHSYRKRK